MGVALPSHHYRRCFFRILYGTAGNAADFRYLLLTYTTSPIRLTDGLESLLGPLKRIRVPVHELAMMMSIALRFIPTLIEETDKIMSAQKARGADFDTGNLLQRQKPWCRCWSPVYLPRSAGADELATAMECRCYHGGEGGPSCVSSSISGWMWLHWSAVWFCSAVWSLRHGDSDCK